MNDDNKKPLPNDDDKYDSQTHRLQSRYTRSELDVDPSLDDLEQDDLLPEDAELDEGVGVDAFFSTDMDEETLPSDDDDSITTSGLDEYNLPTKGKDKLGDEIIRVEDSIEDIESSEEDSSPINSDLEDFAGLEDEYLEEDEPSKQDLMDIGNEK